MFLGPGSCDLTSGGATLRMSAMTCLQVKKWLGQERVRFMKLTNVSRISTKDEPLVLL